MTPRPATDRWERLADFLTQTMESTTASKRVRLSAAMRLADLLESRDKRNAADAQRAQRETREIALQPQRKKIVVKPDKPDAQDAVTDEDRRITGVFAELLKRQERAA